MCRPGYYQSANGPMVTHAFGYMMYGYTLLVPMNQRVLNKSSDYIYMYIFIINIYLYCNIYNIYVYEEKAEYK